MVTGTHRAGGGRLRRFARDYSWVVVVIVLAVVVALCSIPFTTGLAPSWRAGAPAPSSSYGRTVAPMAANGAVLRADAPSPSAFTPPAPPAPSSSLESPPSPSRAAGRIAPTVPDPAPDAAPRATTVALGPTSDGELQASIRLYCWQEFGASSARLRFGPTPAADNWECRGPGFTRVVDLAAMCSWRYGADTFAAFTDRRDAYTWRCFRTSAA
ncbi:hypothetical protein ACIA8K_00070 [Catenuloplanes sp. NPDC051500]|uniref:hypothetical protein n=1 Tax=Catenuloplanes sp. NPDC051500 TaxID=3363959 RepID=UPI0037A74B54